MQDPSLPRIFFACCERPKQAAGQKNRHGLIGVFQPVVLENYTTTGIIQVFSSANGLPFTGDQRTVS
jgi:hypothetical protein